MAVAAVLAALACLPGISPAPAAAQSTAWTTQLLVPPFASSFVSEWERNPQNLTLGVTYLGTAPADYRIEGELVGASRGVLARAISPVFNVAAGPVTEFYTGDDLLGWDVRVTQGSAEDAWRSGVIPDDDYEICVRLVTPDGIQLNESCANFLVELPEAPQLLFPADGDGVNVFQPTFQWTPVILREQLGIDYQVTIVERYPGQVPVAAIEANLPLFEQTVGEAPLLVYPIDAIPLEPGKEYVWQVEVLDGFGDPLIPGGLFSPPQRFTTSDTDAFGRRLGDDGALPESLPLVPGLATLTDLGAVEVESTQDGWLLNGPAWMNLDGPYGVRGRVRLEDLMFDDYGGFLAPSEGRVTIRLESDLPVDADLPVTVEDLEYTPDQGLIASASLELPGGGTVPLDGELQVTAGGLFGELTAGGGAQEIWEGGQDPVEVALTSAALSLPAGTAVLEGRATLFGGVGSCEDLRGAVDTDGNWSVTPVCLPATRTDVTGDGPVAAIELTAVTGPLSVNLETGAMDYALDAQARVDVAPRATTCSIRFTAEARDDTGVSFSGLDPSCDASRARLDAGWLVLGLSGLELAQLGYTPGSGFDLAARVDLVPSLPGFPDLELPTLDDVQLDAQGLSLPSSTWDSPQAGLDLAGFGLAVGSVTIPAIRIDWNDWRASRVGDFAAEFSADLSMPGLPSTAPGCLAAAAPLVLGGAVRDGLLTLDVDGAVGLDADCRVDVVPGVTLVLSGFAGPVEASLASDAGPGLTLDRGLGVEGSLLLEEPFVCQDPAGGIALTSSLEMGPGGRISGEAATAATDCPLTVAGIRLTVEEGQLRIDRAGSPAVAALTAGVLAEPADPQADGPTGQGRLAINLATGEILDGEVELRGPVPLPVPAEDPVFTFTLDRALLTADGLAVDGRQTLDFPDGATMGVTFVEVLVDPAGDGISTGSILFDSEFALDGGVGAQGAVAWAAVSPAAPFDLASGFRVALPAQMALTADGLSVDGTAEARLVYDGRTLGDGTGDTDGDSDPRASGDDQDAPATLQALFRDDFTLGLSPVAVTSGYVDLQLRTSRVAWVDDTGFHPDFVAFGAALLPSRLPLPTEEVAYLELRDDQGNLRIQEEQTTDGLRIFTAPTETVPLVLPALDTDGTGAPRVDVTLDLTLASQGGLQVASGEVVALVDPVAQPELDLSTSGIPFQVRELRYADPQGAGYGWILTGDPVFRGDPVPGASAVLAMEVSQIPGESARLMGLVDVPWADAMDLVPGSTALRFEHQRVTGSFDVALADGSGTWRLALDGTLRLDLDGGGGLGVGAVLEATGAGLAFSSLDVDAEAPPFYFDTGLLQLGVSDLAVPVLAWDESTGWDFELEFDLAFRLPELDGVETAALPDLRLTPGGLDLPSLTFTDFGGGFELEGFRGTPLALRLPALSLDPFSGGPGLDAAWDPSLDFSIALSESGALRWPSLAGVEFTILDASWGLDGLTGTIEPRTLLDPIRLDFGLSGLGLELDTFGGTLGVVNGLQDISLMAGGDLVLPESLRCPASQDPVLALPGTALELFPDGGFGGRLEDAALNCPLTLGPLEVALTDADLVFAFVNDVQAVNLFSDGTLTLPGTAPNTTVSASGTLDVALLEPRVIGGSIAVNQPFRWDIPADDPFLSFNVNQAVLDARGFVLDGSGATRLPDGTAGPSVTFAGLTFDAAGDLAAGSATVQAGLALDGVLSGSTVDWSLADPAQPFSDDGFRLGLSGSATLSPAGLGLTGAGSAELNFNDSTFAALDVDFSGGFTLAAAEARVSAGRADFGLNNTDVAYVTAQGFFPGDVFGVLPLPSRIPLPTEDVAYLQVRDPQTDQPLVETGSDAQGLALSTRQGESVDLVLPSIPDASGNPTTLPVSFSVVANGSSYAIVSGSVEVTDPGPDGLFSLAHLGVPLAVTRVAYDSQSGSGPVLDARLTLPQSLNGLDVRFDGLTVASGGLAGEARVGSLDPAAPSSAPPLAQATLGALTFTVDGARAVFGGGPQGTAGVTLDGSFSSGFFQDPNGTVPRIDFTASLDAAGSFDVQTDATSLPNGRIPISEALLELTSVGATPAVAVAATDQDFALEFSGVLTLPNLAPGFAFTVAGLSVGTDGVSVAGASANLGGQTFELFGADFSLRQTSLGPALGLSVNQQVLVLEMNGDVDFLGQTVEFQGLEVDTRGRVAMAGAALTGDPIPLVPEAVTLDRLAVLNSQLQADLSIDLPAPFDGAGTQQASFTVDADGSVGGGGLITLLEESRGLGGQRTQVDGTLATAHLRYLGLRLTPDQASPGAVEMVGDLYLAGEEQNRIGLGTHDNNSVDPGLALELDGDVRWGPVSLSQSFDFDFDMLRLTVENVSVASSSTEQITVGFGGELRVDLRAISGGLGFSDFRVNSDLSLETAAASIRNGDLAIAGVIGVSLSRFQYSATPTTISGVQGGLVPDSTGSAPSAQSEDIAVQSVLRFGGSLSIGGCVGGNGNCLFSGGVDEFLFYRKPASQGSLTTLVVRGANLEIPGLAMNADLRYEQLDTSGGFEMVLGGSAEFQSRTVAVVGALEKPSSGDLRAGVFVLSSERIEIIPVVLALTEVGGGFFYNPKPEYCRLVREYSGVQDLSSNGTSCEEVGKFTGFLYAGAALIEESVGRAQVLLTISSTYVQLDGQMAFLSPGSTPVNDARIRGTVFLKVGIGKLYAEGNVAVNVDYDPLLTSGDDRDMGEMGFFVYGEDEWGLYGGLSVEVLGLIRGDAEIMVGPPGFYMEGSIQAGFDFWIIAVSGKAEAAIWKVTDSWGAYLAVGVKAEILGGAISASATLRGALVSAPGEPVLVYAGAVARGCVFGLCGEEEIWAKFQGGRVSGGFGSNSTFDSVIAEARRARDQFEAAKDEMQAKIAAAQLLAGLALSDEELAAIYARINEEGGLFVTVNRAISAEGQAWPSEIDQATVDTWRSEDYAYFRDYQDVLFQQGSPRRQAGTLAEDLYAEVQQGLQELQANEATVQSKLAQSLVQIEELQTAADLRDVATSPVSSSNFGAPQTVTNADGSKSLTGGPSFDLDAGASDALRADLQAREVQSRQYARDIAERIQEVEAGVAWLDYVLMDTDADAPLGYARVYADVLQDIQEQYARHGDLMLRQQDWLNSQLSWLRSQRSTVGSAMFRKSELLEGNANDPEAALTNLIQLRAQALDDLSGETTVGQVFLANRQKFEDNTGTAPTAADLQPLADTLGMQLWYQIAEAGMDFAETQAGEAFDSIRAAADRDLAQRWFDHSALTQDIHRVMSARADMVGALYDLYMEYQRSMPDSPPPPSGLDLLQASGNPFYNDALARFQAIQDALEQFRRVVRLRQELQVPVVTDVRVASVNNGYMATELFTWEADHPSGVYEYLYNSVVGPPTGFYGDAGLGLMQSNGNARTRLQYVLTPGRGTTSQDRTLRVGARGGAGYVGLDRAGYQTRFEGQGTDYGPGTPTFGTPILDTSPPPAPTVTIGDHTSDTEVYWTPGTETLADVRWDTWDYQSGIQGYEYAVGSPVDTTLVRDWTPVGGRTELTLRDLNLDPNGPAIITGGTTTTLDGSPTSPFFSATQTTTVQDITIEIPGYRVFVRAVNGDSLWSGVGQSAPIRVDQTPPVFPDTARISQPLVAMPLTFGVLLFGQTTSDPLFQSAYPACPVQSGTLSTTSTGTTTFTGDLTQAVFDPALLDITEPETPVMTFTLPDALDSGSGVARYRWRIAPEPSVDPSAPGWEYTTGTPETLRVEGLPLVYGDSLTLSLAAEDGVGQLSEPIFYRFQVADPTDPMGAVFCSTTGSAPNRVRMKVDGGGYDPESPVVAWDFRIRAEDGTVLQDFPASPDSSVLSPNTLVESEPLTVPDGTRVYGEIRVHNRQGRRTITSSGPLTIDYTPPAAPVLFNVVPQQGSTSTLLNVEYLTRASGTHQWRLLDLDNGIVVSEGTLPGTGGSYRSDRFTVQSPQRQALSSGNYQLVLVTITSTGLSSTSVARNFQVP